MANTSIMTERKTNGTGSQFRSFMHNPDLRTFAVIGFIGLLGFSLASAGVVDLQEVMGNFQWGVLMIYVAMDLFTHLVVETRIMEVIAVRLAKLSGGRRLSILFLFGLFLFTVSSFLNNLTAVQVLLPVLFVLLKAINLNPLFVASLFSLLLAVSNLGGAATPIGDFPALIIMKSGLIDFPNYLLRAFPLFATTALVITSIHLWRFRSYERNGERRTQSLERELGIDFLAMKYRNVTVQWRNLGLISLAFCSMFIGWTLLPADRFPPELTAFIGLSFAMALVVHRGSKPSFRAFDLKPILNISALLFISAIVSSCGVLDLAARMLQQHFQNPTILLLALMISVSILTGLLSAGPTAAAMMPVVLFLSTGATSSQKHLLAVAFAASICAGSSLFLWSATAGFLLLNKVDHAELRDRDGQLLSWDIRTYLRYGVFHFAIQLLVGISWVLIGVKTTS